jgi:hypothetical protein
MTEWVKVQYDLSFNGKTLFRIPYMTSMKTSSTVANFLSENLTFFENHFTDRWQSAIDAYIASGDSKETLPAFEFDPDMITIKWDDNNLSQKFRFTENILNVQVQYQLPWDAAAIYSSAHKYE